MNVKKKTPMIGFKQQINRVNEGVEFNSHKLQVNLFMLSCKVLFFFSLKKRKPSLPKFLKFITFLKNNDLSRGLFSLN